MNKDDEILARLDKIESSGTLKDVDYLIDNISNANKLISNKSYYILCNVKKNNIVKKIIERLKKSEIESEKILLTSICWQSSLNFSAYIELFVKLAISGSLELTIESISVIENIMNLNLSDKTLVSNSLNILDKAVKSQDNEKRALLEELINILNII